MSDIYKAQNPTILVIFGITGDLARRKLVPALFHLHRKKLLPPLFQVVGFSRRAMSDGELRDEVRSMVAAQVGSESATLDSFARMFVYRQGMFEDAAGYGSLAESLGRKDNEWRVCSNKLFYLAVPPEHYESIFRHIESSGLTEPCSPEEGWTRVVVEKPFGKDLKTAERLDILLGKLFKEEQIYRIDHYLGKETVQNILAFRFSNSFLGPAWDKKAIEEIRIRLFEAEGVEQRGAFYDGVGALRDVGQNHLLQLLALFTMEQPIRFDAHAVRAGRLAVLRALRQMSGKDIRTRTLRGQYAGYRKTKGAAPDSETETFFRITAFLKTRRWRGVPMVLESGKSTGSARAEVEVRFRHEEPCLCPPNSGHTYRNVLRYRIQPDEGVSLSFWVKRPGTDMVVEEKDFSFSYKGAFDPTLFIDAYEKLLLDTIQGNQTLFVSTDEIKASWKFIDPIVEAWRKNAIPLTSYEPGTIPDSSSDAPNP